MLLLLGFCVVVVRLVVLRVGRLVVGGGVADGELLPVATWAGEVGMPKGMDFW